MIHGRTRYHKDNRPEGRVDLSSHRIVGEYKQVLQAIVTKKKKEKKHTHDYVKKQIFGMKWSFCLNIPRCC